MIADLLAAARGTLAVALRRADPVGAAVVGVAGLLLAAGGVLMADGFAGWVGEGSDHDLAAPHGRGGPGTSPGGESDDEPGGGPLVDVLGMEPAARRAVGGDRAPAGGTATAAGARAPGEASVVPTASTPGTAGAPATSAPGQPPDGDPAAPAPDTTTTTEPAPTGGHVGSVLGGLVGLLGLA